MKCERCGTVTSIHTTSYFNVDDICMECQAIEQAHPLYATAKAAEVAACRRGDFKFPGIGLPPELRKH